MSAIVIQVIRSEDLVIITKGAEVVFEAYLDSYPLDDLPTNLAEELAKQLGYSDQLA